MDDDIKNSESRMEWRLIDVLIIIVIGLNIWSIKTTHELTVDMAVLKTKVVTIQTIQSETKS